MTDHTATATATSTALTPALAAEPGFAPESRVWVYVTGRPLTAAESREAQTALDAFTRQWTAHNQALLAKAEVFQNQMVILMVDETKAGASGCSIDKSVHFLENLGDQLNVDFFERMRFGWVEGDKIAFAGRPEFAALAGEGHITETTRVVNTLAQTRRELLENWLLPFGKSWHRRMV